MTLEQTRQLGIEFERRVQIMIPEKEFSEKLDTETIYSFLNQYQDKLVHEIYRELDNIQSPSNRSAYVETLLQGLLCKETIQINEEDRIENKYKLDLPQNFGLYINSITKVTNAYGYKKEGLVIGDLLNTLISQSKLLQTLQSAQDSMRILRNPVVCIDNKKMQLIVDMYTKPYALVITYYKTPQYMNLMTSTPCELPMDAFEDLVTGAVDLYVGFVYGAEERRKKQIAQAQQRAREDERDARRNNTQED